MRKVLVIGSINVDFTLHGVEKFPAENEEVDVSDVTITAGGKSRNIAAMISALSSGNEVEFIGKMAKDPYGLYKLPIQALEDAGVETGSVIFAENESTLPGMAFIPVDKKGNNAIYEYGGANDLLSKEDVDRYLGLIDELSKDNGLLVINFEMPLETAVYIAEKANERGVRVILEPGGIRENDDIKTLTGRKYFLIKPNHTEAEILTGVKVVDFNTARHAGNKLLELGAENAMITIGNKGAFFMNREKEEEIPIDELGLGNDGVNETGTGDQVLAAFCAYILKGKTVFEAAKIAVTAGTLQYHKPNIEPVTLEELEKYI
jgi:ribokinase